MLSRRFGSSKNLAGSSSDSKQSSPIGSQSKLPRVGSKQNIGPKINSFDGLFDKEISGSMDNVSKVGKKYETTTKNNNDANSIKESKNPAKSFHSSLNINSTSGQVSSMGDWFNEELDDNSSASSYLKAPHQPMLKRPKSVENLLRS